MALLRGTGFFRRIDRFFTVFLEGDAPVRTNEWNPPVLLRFYTGFADGFSFRWFRLFGLPVPYRFFTGFFIRKVASDVPFFFRFFSRTSLKKKQKHIKYRFFRHYIYNNIYIFYIIYYIYYIIYNICAHEAHGHGPTRGLLKSAWRVQYNRASERRGISFSHGWVSPNGPNYTTTYTKQIWKYKNTTKYIKQTHKQRLLLSTLINSINKKFRLRYRNSKT